MAFTCAAPSGSKLSLEFREYADSSARGSIDASHKGPISIWLKSVSDMKTKAAGSGWFKIWEQGYDAGAGKWATETLIDNSGLLSIQLPSALSTGYYLARHEIITLQNVTNDKTDAQFYVGCAQLWIEGTATSSSIPSDKQVSIPGHIQADDPALTFNIYKDDPKTYKTPNLAAFFPTAGTAGSNPRAKIRQPGSQTEGTIPSTCLVKNANWCAAEVPSYTSEAGCWAASEDCYKQLDVCYTSAPPTGSKGCKVWEEQKCTVLQQACQSGKFQGPPEAGKKLGEGAVDEPIPGGKIPAAVNQGQAQEQAQGGGGEVVAGSTATATATAAAAGASTTKVSRCKSRRRARRARGTKE